MPRDPPADGGEALGRAYAEDAGRDRVRRADRRTKERRAGDDQRGRRFAGEAVNGFQFEDLMPHGFDDFPAAHGSTERHKGGTEELDPEGLKMKRARVITPIVFWASFIPWLVAMNAAEST